MVKVLSHTCQMQRIAKLKILRVKVIRSTNCCLFVSTCNSTMEVKFKFSLQVSNDPCNSWYHFKVTQLKVNVIRLY